MQNLVIVESPTKARTLSKFLGKNYRIEASMGHIRDLPKSELGVDVENNFEPRYIIPRDKKKKVGELKKIALDAKTIWLASDPDREGEAIAWHIAALLQEREKGNGKSSAKKTSPFTLNPLPVFKRVVFHEITESAIKDAFEHPRDLNLQLVDAQQARRVLDRLVGYKLSPLLWKKVKRGLSAGRVQTVALRLIVEREREIDAFKAIEYWSIEAEVSTRYQKPSHVIPESSASSPRVDSGEAGRESSQTMDSPMLSDRSPDSHRTLVKPEDDSFFITLVEVNGEKMKQENEKFLLKNESEAKKIVKELEKADYRVNKITQKEVRRYPQAPFTTSTLQQSAGNKLGMSAKKTMMLAQNLYEHGLISYMRTDSVTISSLALGQMRDFIGSKYGKNYLPQTPRVYKSKSKNVQEAHEAIRPTNFNTSSEDIKGDQFTRDHKKLYDLIFKRTVASQMSEAVLDQTTVDVSAISDEQEAISQYLLRATGSVMKFDGWLKLYGVIQESEVTDESKEPEERKQILPELEEGEQLGLQKVLPSQHFTQPPPRFTESSLVKKLEELGIGRPSTYAPIISTIQDRFYVERVERKFNPTALGLAVNDFLMKYFPDVFNYAFTAQMEDELDEVANGTRQWRSTISEFYAPFEKKLAGTEEKAEKVHLEVETVDKYCPKCGKQLVVRTGRFGKFLACSGFPECKHTEAIESKIDAKCPEDGGDIVIRKTRKGKTFYGCKNYPDCKFASWTKPK